MTAISTQDIQGTDYTIQSDVLKMKNSINYILILGFTTIILLMLEACEEEINLVSESQFSPIVYCILNPQDSVHYLRIGRSYVYEGDANNYKPVYDSLIYPEAYTAYLAEKNNQRIVNEYVFRPDDEFIKDSGLFELGPCQVNSVKCNILSGTEYSLFVHSNESSRLIASKIEVISPIEIIEPIYYPGKSVTLLPDQSLELQWTVKEAGLIYQCFINVKFLEGNKEFQTLKAISYRLSPVIVSGVSELASDFLNGKEFFNFLKKELPLIGSGYSRKLVGFDFEIWAGGPEMALFFSNNKELNTPIGSIRDYSNMDGAQGIFSSRVRAISKNNVFSDLTHNFLADSEETKALGFLRYKEDFK